MPRIYVNQPAIVRLGPSEVTGGLLPIYELKRGWNTVPDQLLEHAYVKALMKEGGHPAIPDGKPTPEAAPQAGVIVKGVIDPISGAPAAHPVASQGTELLSGPGPVPQPNEPPPPTREEKPQPDPEQGDSKAQKQALADSQFDHDGDGKPGGSKPGPRSKKK